MPSTLSRRSGALRGPAGIVRLAATGVLLACTLVAQSTRLTVPAPVEVVGFEPGTDRKLADYFQVYAYFQTLAATSDRVLFSSIGRTSEDHDLGLAIISSPQNLRNLEEIRKTNLALVDPRKLRPGEAASLIARGKTIVCLNASIHSVEVGPTQATLPLAHFLATTQDPDWLKILDDVVLLMLPCHNPDGYLKQVEWYRANVGTKFEACPLPGLYHKYAGHDNNRDWFMFNLQETRLTVTQVYRPWCPQIVMDMHQMADDGARMFLPPYQDPTEPNVEPLLIERLNELGTTVRKELLAKGLKGIVNKSIFDAWSPSRAFMHYHGGVRFLCEIASCRQATPIERRGIGKGASTRPELNPAPWTGERWALADIIRYHNEAALAVLRHASANRERWLTNFHEVFRKACTAEEKPTALSLSLAKDGNDDDRRRLANVLALGGVEAFDVSDQPTIEDRDLTRVDRIIIPSAQPFFSFARALLTKADYPEILEDGVLRKPYDMTAHDVGLLLGLDARVRITTLVAQPSPDRRWRAEPSSRPADGGAFLRMASPGSIAIYQSFVPNVTDEGWTRLMFDTLRAPYRMITDRDVAQLAEVREAPATNHLRVLILPSLTADQILNGNRTEEFPPEFRGGIGNVGADWIDRFVRGGGTLIALRDATALPIRLFRLPIRNAFASLPEGRRLTIPGAILALDVNTEHPLASRYRISPLWGPRAPSAVSSKIRRIPAVFDGAKAFEPSPDPDRDQTLQPVSVARWAPMSALRLAGYAEDLDLVAEKDVLIQCKVGAGQVILFGFSPQHRLQTWSTVPLLVEAIVSGLPKN